jgi:hypothetical protein
MFIAVINQSTLVNDNDVSIMCKAIQTQLTLHLLPAWGLKRATCKFYSDVTKIPGHAWIVTLMDNSDIAGALGYHCEDNDKVDAYVFCKPILEDGGAILSDPAHPQNFTVSSVLSHEICEMIGDRFANTWVDGPMLPMGNEYAMELCDPVEGDFYPLLVSNSDGSFTTVNLSNFVFPSWFNQQAKVSENMPFDYMKKLTAPFTMTLGGYLLVRKGGRVYQVFGDKLSKWKKHHVQSKWYRR